MNGVGQAMRGGVRVELGVAQPGRFPAGPTVGHHNLQERQDLFGDQALLELLDRVPRSQVIAISSGSNPDRPGVGEMASHDGLSSRDLLRALQRGSLWLNVTFIDRVDRRFSELVRELHAAVSQAVPGFHPDGGSATLILSAPGASAAYHLDGPPSLLWHLRGQKRLWVYPALDYRFVSPEQLERIVAGTAHEYLPYQRGFDTHATVLDLEPGALAAWPQNAPHRVENQGTFNVSLNTDYYTQDSRRRARLFAAHHALRTLGYAPRSNDPTGPRAWAKVLAHRGLSALGLSRAVIKRHDPPRLRVDPDAELGVREVA